jgi:tRNA threonylcarbamoyladenosine biosynthesis protein TsaB
MRLVAIDTSSKVASVAAFEDGLLVRETAREAESTHAEVLVPMLDELFARLGWQPHQVGRWAVDIGPGSFTGLRVGLAAVKGIVFATGAQLVAVGALDALTLDVPPGDVAVSVLEAGKREVFLQAKKGRAGIALANATHLPADRAAEWVRSVLPPSGTATVVGRAAAEIDWSPLRGRVTLWTAPPYDWPRASAIGRLARGAPAVEDIDALEPVYLRPPELTSPSRMGFPG